MLRYLETNTNTIFEGTQAVERLSRLNIASEHIKSAGLAAVMVHANATRNNTQIGPGVQAWDIFNRTLRDLCCGANWSIYQEQGVEGIISNDNTLIVPSSGNVATGNPKQPASNKNPKGFQTMELIRNIVQGSLFSGFSNQLDDDKPEIYVLLYYYNSTELRLELSKPALIKNGRIVAWSERIIIPTINLNDDPNLNFGTVIEDEIDIPIMRKNAG